MAQPGILICIQFVFLSGLTAAQYIELFKHACMDQTEISLSCSPPNVIYILNAQYGLYTDLSDTCPEPGLEDCLVDSYHVNNATMQDLQTECEEKSSCSHLMQSENLLPWCSINGMDFMLITYTCYEAGGLPTTLPPTEPTTMPTTRIPSTTEKENDNTGEDNTAAIVGGVIGGLIVIAFFGIIIFVVIRNNNAANARARANPLKKRKKPKTQQNGSKPTDSELEKAFSNIANDPNGCDNQAYGFIESEAQPLTKAKRLSMAAAANSAAERAIEAELAKPLSEIEEVDGKKASNGHVKDANKTNEDKSSNLDDKTVQKTDVADISPTVEGKEDTKDDDSNIYEAVEMKVVDKKSNDS